MSHEFPAASYDAWKLRTPDDEHPEWAREEHLARELEEHLAEVEHRLWWSQLLDDERSSADAWWRDGAIVCTAPGGSNA